MNMLKLYKQPPISDSSTCQNVFWKLSYPVFRFSFVLDVPAKLVEIGKKQSHVQCHAQLEFEKYLSFLIIIIMLRKASDGAVTQN